MPRRRKRPEDALQKFIVQSLRLLASRDVMFFSVPNEGKRSKTEGQRLRDMGLRAGVADLVIIVNRLPHFLECKSGKETQSSSQIAFEAECRDRSLPYALVRSPEQAVDVLMGWRAITRNPLSRGVA